MSKHNKDPQEHKTQDQLLAEKKQKEETNRKRRRVAGELFPFLTENAASVEDAKMLCQIVSAGIRQAYGNKMREQDIASLGLVEKLNPKDPRFKVFVTLLEMFGTETIFDALDILEGLPKHLDGCITEEMKKRELKDLKVEFLPDIPLA